MLVTAYVIYDGTTSRYVGDQNSTVQINCERLQAYSPRPVWLLRYLAPGDGTDILYQPTFSVTSAQLLDTNTLQGFWIEVDGKDIIIDVQNSTVFSTACNACCGSNPIIARFYTNGIASFVPLTGNTFCITRSDAGDTAAHSQVALDYMTNIYSNPIRTYWFSGTSRYQVQSFYTTLNPVGTDTVASGTCAS
jgi:hypothetical protein